MTLAERWRPNVLSAAKLISTPGTTRRRVLGVATAPGGAGGERPAAVGLSAVTPPGGVRIGMRMGSIGTT